MQQENKPTLGDLYQTAALSYYSSLEDKEHCSFSDHILMYNSMLLMQQTILNYLNLGIFLTKPTDDLVERIQGLSTEDIANYVCEELKVYESQVQNTGKVVSTEDFYSSMLTRLIVSYLGSSCFLPTAGQFPSEGFSNSDILEFLSIFKEVDEFVSESFNSRMSFSDCCVMSSNNIVSTVNDTIYLDSAHFLGAMSSLSSNILSAILEDTKDDKSNDESAMSFDATEMANHLKLALNNESVDSRLHVRSVVCSSFKAKKFIESTSWGSDGDKLFNFLTAFFKLEEPKEVKPKKGKEDSSKTIPTLDEARLEFLLNQEKKFSILEMIKEDILTYLGIQVEL